MHAFTSTSSRLSSRVAAGFNKNYPLVTCSSSSGKPRLAIVRGVPETFSNCITMEKPLSVINLEIAKQQHSEYVKILRGLVSELVELPADNSYPDCPFIEDTAVVIGSNALITRPGASSRRGEAAVVKSALKELGFDIFEVDPPGTIDGGDVLYAEGTLFVGKSRRTNEKGIEALARAFPEIPVVPIQVAETLHLKSVLSWLGQNTFLAEENVPAQEMFKKIQQASSSKAFHCVSVPDQGAANILCVGESLIYPSAYPAGTLPSLYKAFAKQVIPADISEFHKGDGGLTCLSIIID